MQFCRRSTPAEGREGSRVNLSARMTGQAAGGCSSSSPQARLQRAEKAQPGKYRRRCLPQPTPPLPTTHSQLAPLHNCLVSHRLVATPTSFRPLHRFCLVSSLLPLVHLVSPRLVTFATAPNSRRLSSSCCSTSSSSSICNRAPGCSASFSSHLERVTHRRRIETVLGTATSSFLIATAPLIVTRRERRGSAIAASLFSMATSNLRQ